MPDRNPTTVSNFVENSQRYSQVKVHHLYHGINDTSGKFANGVNDTHSKIDAGINDTSGEFATGIYDTRSKFFHQFR